MMVSTTPHTLRRAAPSADRQGHLGSSLRARVNAWTAAWVIGAALAVFQGAAVAAAAQPLALTQIYHSTLPGDRVQIQLKLSGPAPKKPLSFSIDKPARIALDLANTVSRLPSRTVSIGVGAARSVTAVEAAGRTRVVINLTNPVGYKTSVDGDSVYVTLEGGASGKAQTPSTSHIGANQVAAGTAGSIQSIGFHRGADGQGRIIVKLSDPSIPVDMKKQGDSVLVNFDNTSLPDRLERRLDVTDFATPVKTIDTYSDGNNVKMVIAATGDFDDIAYQTDNTFTVEVKPTATETAQTGQGKKKKYTGQRLSLNFQNISVRAVLQLLADFTGLNMVTSDAVKGNLTLRLKNVPWDQALDIILKSRGLAMRRDGNVIMVAPAAEMAAQEKLEQQTKEAAPLENATIQINYAKAKDIAKLLKSKGNSLLSKRGNITVDDRTNKLLIQDTAENIQAMRTLIAQLDVPVRQVLIESRIVLATNSFSKELGVRFGVSKQSPAGGTTNGTNTILSGSDNAVSEINNGQTLTSPDRLNVNLPVTQLASTAGTIGLAVTKLPFGTLLELELSAAQAEGRTEIVSSPRVITADQKSALIEQGAEIPYQRATSSGATAVSFKKAVLSLKVTPQITPDNRVIMDLKVNKDSPDFANALNGVPPINTQSLTTQVLVNNGQTVVLGGVYQMTKTHQINRVPFFGDLPIVGFLFRNKYVQDNKSELLIFITPKILKQGLHL